jgi:hypothetical protein
VEDGGEPRTSVDATRELAFQNWRYRSRYTGEIQHVAVSVRTVAERFLGLQHAKSS